MKHKLRSNEEIRRSICEPPLIIFELLYKMEQKEASEAATSLPSKTPF